ncbi:glycoside hydrolase family 16 protein [Pisolithus tinctorius Marx 270]|uniref:Glycoside hydrolase family 16 protein n=1 Tax=Pisolithus tinctorius Marx 270 TaxID=870435 RepID=A0A0C3NTY2_PISTI|nr:glycoside hydrolase family 16 protein [Pisolithus tinctorius Marx 270]
MSPLNGLFLPDRRLWACTCPGELYPGPVHSNGNHSVPGIDALEATFDDGVWKVRVSVYVNTWDNFKIYDPTISVINSYQGSECKLATTYEFSLTHQDCCELDKGCHSVRVCMISSLIVKLIRLTSRRCMVNSFENGCITWISRGGRL